MATRLDESNVMREVISDEIWVRESHIWMVSLDDIVQVASVVRINMIVVFICHSEFLTDPFFPPNTKLCQVALKSCGAVNQPKKSKNLK